MAQPNSEDVTFLPLYASHFLQTFGDRLWQFALPILFTEVYDNSIMPQAIFAFGTYSAVFLAMPGFGSWIDSTNRSRVITLTIFIQNICIVISSILLYFIGLEFDLNPNITIDFVLLFSGCLIASMIGQIMGMGATLALEKDWVPILCQANKSLLTTINGRMRRIDLFCKLMAPALFGVVTQYLGNNPKQKIRYGAAWIMAWNIIGLVLEYYTIQIVYKNNPILATCALKAQQQEKEKEFEKEKQLSYGSVSEESDGPKPTKVNENQVVKVTKSSLLMNRKRAKHNNITKLIDGWSFYMKSEMLWASISYCMLYMSVLDGGSLVAAYLRTEGISYSVLGITKGIGALFGILGTLLTPLLANTCGLQLELVGVFMIWMFFFCLFPSGIQFFAEKVLNKNIFASNVSIDDAYVILFCMIIARCGLWAFDLVENQLMQERVKSNRRAQVNGVQVSVSQLFFIFVAVLAMIFSETSKFYILVFITLGNIFIACVIYTLWYSFACCQRLDEKDDDNTAQYDKMGASDSGL
eukprot:501921_1